MRSVLLFLLVSCSWTDRPVDLVSPSPIYCRPVNADVQVCRDGNDWPWLCEIHEGRWRCEIRRDMYHHRPTVR